jgi:hypothetical protein
MSIYNFCTDCPDKIIERDENGNLVNYTCPARFNPFDEDSIYNEETHEREIISKCTRHEKFMKMEKQKRDGGKYIVAN